MRTAADGRDALARIDEALPDLIVSDVMMPEMDGLELLSIVRGHPLTGESHSILLTARGSSEDIVGGLDLGADDYCRSRSWLASCRRGYGLKSRDHQFRRMS